MVVHILNGDSLAERFPESIEGEQIVARECLVDGDVHGETLEEFFKNRAQFLYQAYDIPTQEYEQKTLPEFEKIKNLGADDEVNLWFEDDLFCQTNLWFTVSLLRKYTPVKSISLVRPEDNIRYGFAGLDEAGLIQAFIDKISLSDSMLTDLSNLWKNYQSTNTEEMHSIAQSSELSFLNEAVKAYIDSIPSNGNPGRPKRTLKAIMDKVGSEKFGPVFQEFNKSEGIYGFGDLQVKRMFDELKSL